VTPLRLGTRGSALALAQARWVAERLGSAGEEIEIVEVVTAGDRGEQVGDKARWVTELESALLAGRIDVAVHSAKDVPGELPDGLEIVAAPERGDARDALIGASSLDDLPADARVGTSSLRRRAQLLAARPDLDVVDMRGNVDTRLRKLGEGEWDAIVLAAAGLARLGLTDRIGAYLDPAEFVPAPGQGTLALEARTNGARHRACAALSNPAADACLRAERALAHALGASCNTPVGAYAQPKASDPVGCVLTGFAGLPDGSEWVRDTLEGPMSEPEALGRAVAERLNAVGAAEILARAEEVAA
jgi:hydroxymethylbilane synthase